MAEGQAQERNCPYCHTGLDPGDKTQACPVCGAVHHDDCWQEGGGCAVFGCNATAESADDSLVPPVEQRAGSSGPGGWWHSSRRRYLVLSGSVLVAAAIAVVLVLVLTGDDDEPPRSGQTTSGTRTSNGGAKKKSSPGKKGNRGSGSARKNKQQREKMKRNLGLLWTADPDGNWEGYLPTEGWNRPVSQGQQSEDESTPRFRTMVDGPDGDFILVDTTPNLDPTEDPANFAVGEIELNPKRIETALGVSYMLVSDEASDECDGITCVRILMSDGDGGGIALYAGSSNPKRAKLIAREFAGGVKPLD